MVETVTLSIRCPYCGARKQRRTDKACKYFVCQHRARLEGRMKYEAELEMKQERQARLILEERKPLLVGVLVCHPFGGMGLRIYRPHRTIPDEDDAVIIQWPIAEAIAAWTVEQFLAVKKYIQSQKY